MVKKESRFLQVPKDYSFKPANGTVDKRGFVTVSGVNITPEQLDQSEAFFELDRVFADIDERLKKEDETNENKPWISAK